MLELECPQCNEKVVWSDEFPYRPFCSKRCQMIDFGSWANEDHKLAGDSMFDSMSSEDEQE